MPVALSKRGAPIVHFKTSQSGHLRTIFDSLRDLIQDINLHFIPDESTENTPGILFTAMDNNHVAMAHLKMPADQIRRADVFECKRQCCAGISVVGFWKCLKTMGAQDVVSLTLYENDPDCIYLLGEDVSMRKRREFVIKLLDIDEETPPIPDADFECVFTMNSAQFQRLCRDLAAVEPENVVVETRGNTLVWRGEGPENSLEVSYESRTEDEGGILFETHDTRMKICNKYSLKYLTMFTKAAALCNDFRIHLKPKYPIILDYEVAGLGLLRFCLAPRIEEGKDDEADTEMVSDEDLF